MLLAVEVRSRNVRLAHPAQRREAGRDGILFCHAQSDNVVIGTCRVARAGFPDPEDDAWTAVEIALEAIRKVPSLSKMTLLQRGSRLSVQPVAEAEWAIVLRMGRG